MEMLLLVGPPGSGKSTYYRNNFAKEYSLVSRDVEGTKAREKKRLIELMNAGEKIAVDNTNVTRKARKRYLELAKEYSYSVACVEIVADVDTCIERNKQRTGKAKVPVVAIHTASKRYEKPMIDEGFSHVYSVRG